MTRKETYRRILIRIIWFMILFTCLFSYWYLRGRIPGKLHVITGEEDQFRFPFPWAEHWNPMMKRWRLEHPPISRRVRRGSPEGRWR